MPGIAGIVGASGTASINKPALDAMVKAMMHERFYVSGTYQNDLIGIGVGWVSHKESFSDCLPIWNERKDICLVFSGEHFADRTEVEKFRAQGHDCAKNNASYLIHLYEESGSRFFELLNGCFSGVLVDLREKKVVLFNDRYGLNRIYYHESAEGFYFASEAKALLKVLPQLRRLDMASLGEFFSCGCALQNRTLFFGVSLLPGGSMWTFRPQQQAKKEVYFKREIWENQPLLSAAEYYEKLRDTFRRVLPRYFSTKQRVGLSLTGGLDSRMILAWAPCAPFKLECYTFGGPYRECSDVRIARLVAKASQQYHSVIPLNSKFFAEFPALAKRSVFFTDGAMDVSGAAGLFVNRMAREVAPVRLTGNYGDQILRGHVAFKPSPLCQAIFDGQFVPLIQKATATYSREKQERRTSFVAFKQVPWHHYAMFALEQTQLTVRSPYLDNDLVGLVYQAPPEMSDSVDLALRMIGDGDAALAGIPTDRGVVGSNGLVANKIRSLYQEFTIRAEYVYDYGMPQWLAKVDHVFDRWHLERLFLGRHKFYHFRVWYRDQLAKYVQDVLLDHRTLNRSYLDGRQVSRVVGAHTKGEQNYTLEIHKLLTSELIQRQLVERKWDDAQ
jgi:asparagine synthase (glutamine-hydrolysing)